MPAKPILLFPLRSKVSYNAKLGGGTNTFNKPNKTTQIGRIVCIP